MPIVKRDEKHSRMGGSPDMRQRFYVDYKGSTYKFIRTDYGAIVNSKFVPMGWILAGYNVNVPMNIVQDVYDALSVLNKNPDYAGMSAKEFICKLLDTNDEHPEHCD